MSDDLTHDTSFVWNLQSTLCSEIKEKFPKIKKMEYFSDGCAGQYKNFKNFLNLTYHVEDFGIAAVWTFFATSHGKSPCDGLGGTIKRKLYCESLTRLVGNYILTSQQAFEYCQETMNIFFFHVNSEDLVDKRIWLELRYQKGMTLPGTRSFHSYTPDGIGKLSYKRTSEDTKFAGTWSFFEHTPDFKASDFLIGDYVAYFYDEFLWVGCIINLDTNANEVLINFLHDKSRHVEPFLLPGKRRYLLSTGITCCRKVRCPLCISKCQKILFKCQGL